MEYLQENWEDLANAVIIQAVKDYRVAYRRLLRHPGSIIAQMEIERLERFFFGKWYAALTSIDPHYLLKRVKGEIVHDKLELLRQTRCNNQSAERL